MFELVYKFFRRLSSIFYCIRYKNCFSFLGKDVRIYSPLKIQGNKSIVIGNKARLGEGIWLASISHDSRSSSLVIGDNVLIGHYNHIYCTLNIVIENDVLIADKVYISDNSHSFEDINVPIWQQQIKQLKGVVIGEGSWIGENVCIIGASVGKHCVIGANAVVTKDIPDYSVAVGAPAQVIKSYDFTIGKWVKII